MVMESVQSIISINESNVKSMLAESVSDALLEINHRDATVPFVDKMDAQDEIRRGNDIEVLPDGTALSFYDKRRKSSEEIYKRLTHGIIDNVGEHFELSFGREGPDESITDVEFHFNEALLLTKNRLVIQGDAKMSRSDIPIEEIRPSRIQIDYKFDEQQFYEAVYCANGSVRDLRPLSLDYAGVKGYNNIETAKKLIHFVSLCYYSVQDGKTDI